MIVKFVLVLGHYLIEVLPFVAIGLFLSGLIHEFIPTKWVEKHLGRKGVRPILYSTLAGTVLPICCIGSLPVAISLHQKGARLGSVLAFLVATPATSVTALLVCYGLLGIKFTVFIFFAVILMGLVMGAIGNLIKFAPRSLAIPLYRQGVSLAKDPVCGMSVEMSKGPKTEYKGKNYYFCSSHCQASFEKGPDKYVTDKYLNIRGRMSSVLKYAFVDMVKEIGPEMLLGLILAALVRVATPIGILIKQYLGGGWGYLFSLVFGLIMYICSTASVPLVDAFLNQGMNIGGGMVLLLVGPITSYGTILVLRKEFGGKILLIYLGVLSMMSLALGYCFSII